MIETYRSSVDALVWYSAIDLRDLWDPSVDAIAARDALALILPELVDVYGQAAAALAADWYDEMRDEAKIAGRFRAIVADLPGATRTDALAGWAVDPLFSETPDFAAARTRVEGGLQRIVADAGRDTIAQSSVEDPNARGWQRAGSGECEFCLMLIARGAVYTRKTADFAAHDHCRCAAVPAWEGKPLPVKPYVPSARSVSEADRARVREYLRAN